MFRGTYLLNDWWSNLRWITNWFQFGWDQYDLTRAVANYVDTDLINDTPELQGNGEPEIIAVGHSLGGGLAQQAGYASEKINRVYSFNGSAVTGFYSANKSNRTREVLSTKRIYRIGERGEVLAIFRNIMRTIYPVLEKNPKIVEVTYNFGEFGLIRNHSISDLACALE